MEHMCVTAIIQPVMAVKCFSPNETTRLGHLMVPRARTWETGTLFIVMSLEKSTWEFT